MFSDISKRNERNNLKRKENRWLRIEYKKKAVKYINSADKTTKKRLKNAIEKIPFGDIRFVPEDEPTPDELQAILDAKADTSPTTPHEAINWD